MLKKIGHPIWKYSVVEPTCDGSTHILYVPFVKRNKKRTTAYLIAYLDLDSDDEEVKISIKTTAELESIKKGNLPITRNTSQDIERFMTFDEIIFQQVTDEFDELYCDACQADNIDEMLNLQTTARTCETNSIVICRFATGTNEYNNTGGGVYSGSSSPTSYYPSGELFLFGATGDAEFGSTTYDPFWTAVSSFISNAWGSGAEAIRNLWRSIFTFVRCPSFIEIDDNVSTRDTDDYICAEYLLTFCLDGQYWNIEDSELVEGSDHNVTEEEYYAKICMENKTEFLSNYPSNIRRRLSFPLNECCDKLYFDSDCALEKIVEEFFTPETPKGEYLILSEAFEDCFGAPNSNGEFIDCATSSASYSVTLYVDQPVAGTRETYTDLGDGTDVGHTFMSVNQNVGGSENRLVFGYYPLNYPYPITPVEDPSVWDNDGDHYDVSITYTISCTEFNDFLQESISQSQTTYHLQDYNCTDFALNTFNNSAGANLPDTYGSWGIFYGGSNPGDLGEDIRAMLNSPGISIDKQGGSAPNSNCN